MLHHVLEDQNLSSNTMLIQTLQVILIIKLKKKITTSYVFTLTKKAMSCISKLQTIVTLSIIEAKYMTVMQACKKVIWIKRLLEEFGYKQKKITLSYDC